MRLAASLVLLAPSRWPALVWWRAAARTRRRRGAVPPSAQFVRGGRRARSMRYMPGHGPDLVLIHGASGNLRDFTFR